MAKASEHMQALRFTRSLWPSEMHVRVMAKDRIEISADDPTRKEIISAVIAEIDVMPDAVAYPGESFLQVT